MKICRHLLLRSECMWCHIEGAMRARQCVRWLVTFAVLAIVGVAAGMLAWDLLRLASR